MTRTALATDDWRQHAACAHMDPEIWFPVSSGLGQVAAVNRAKAICRRCPVRVPCLDEALSMPSGRRNVNQVRGGRYFATPASERRTGGDA